jgi:hypothetical protein
VPAFPLLYSGRDAFHGHKRRYTRERFSSLFPDSTFNIIKLTWFNSILFGPAALVRLARKISGFDKPAPDLSTPPAPVNATLRGLFSLERLWLSRFNFPFGLSLLCLAQKKTA